jgi:hypothetical protein
VTINVNFSVTCKCWTSCLSNVTKNLHKLVYFPRYFLVFIIIFPWGGGGRWRVPPAHAAAMGAMIPVFFGFDWRGGLGLPVSIFEKGEDGFPRSEEWCCVLPLVAARDGNGGYGQ